MGVAVVVLISVAGPLAASGSPATELVRGAVFGVALTLVVFAKLIVMWWALLAFVASGFEHSVANMTIFGLGVLEVSAT